jgi:hypothetical protein
MQEQYLKAEVSGDCRYLITRQRYRIQVANACLSGVFLLRLNTGPYQDLLTRCTTINSHYFVPEVQNSRECRNTGDFRTLPMRLLDRAAVPGGEK